jgi:hypothetical protein
MHGARMRGFVAHHVATEERVRSLADAGRTAVDAASAGTRQPLFALVALLAVLWLLGSRVLLGDGVPAIGTMARWPGIGDLLSAYASGWRYTGLGSATAAPPGLVAMAGFTTALFGAGGLARTVLVVAAFPAGALGAYRLTRTLSQPAAAAVVAALAYAINPVPRNAIANGRLGPLVLFALAPFLVSTAVRLSERVQGDQGARRRGRTVLGLAILVALAWAWYPLAPLVLVAAAVAVVLAVPFVGDIGLGMRMLAASVVATVIAGVLLFPWSLNLLGAGDDPAAAGFTFRPRLDLADVLRFHSGPSGAGWSSWGLLAAAALALLFGRGPRFAWATRAWMLALLGWALVWLPSEFATDVSVPAPEAGLTLAALGIAVAAGLGVSTFVEDVRRLGFGARQAVAALAAAGFLVGALGFAADAGEGRWGAPDGDWTDTLAFLDVEHDNGGFRVLWLGDPSVLPLDPVVASDGTGYVLTRNGAGDATELWRAPAHTADNLVGEAVNLASSRRTERLGHLIAPMSVRYVALPSRLGPGAARAAPSRQLGVTLDDQIDLARLEAPPGLVLYENTAWIPDPGAVPPADVTNVPLGSKNPTAAALRADVGHVTPVRGPAGDTAPTGPGLVLWSEANDADWSASASGRDLRHVEPFGWANGFEAPARSSISIRYEGQSRRYLLITLQLAAWVLAFVILVRTRAGRRPHTRRGRTRRPNL